MKYSENVYMKALAALAALRTTLSEKEQHTVDFVAEAIAEKADRDTGPATNADRIRSMSDEELAAMLLDWQMNDQAANWCTDEQGCAGRGEGFECTDEKEAACIVRWLREPAGGAI